MVSRSSIPSGVLLVQPNSGVNSRLLTPLSPVRVPFGELVFRSGNPTKRLTRLRGSELLSGSCGFPAIFAKIHAVDSNAGESQPCLQGSGKSSREAEKWGPCSLFAERGANKRVNS